MNTTLWIVQAVLAAVFAASGALKAIKSKAALVSSGQTGVKHYGLTFIRFIAISELFGAAGLIAPGLTGTARYLTPIAAAGLAVIMVGAAISHTRLAREDPARRRRESRNVGINLVILMACVGVTLARAVETLAPG